MIKQKTSSRSIFFWASSLFFLSIFAYFACALKFQLPFLIKYDRFFTDIIRSELTPFRSTIFKAITFLANTNTLVVLTLLLTLFLLLRKKIIPTLFLLINVGVSAGIINQWAKMLFNRPRPTLLHLVHAGGTSFPSGHSMGSALFYGSLIYLLPLIFPNHPKFRKSILLLCLLLILLIPISRVYVGVHFPSDVTAGTSLGLALLFATIALFEHFSPFYE